MLITHSLIWYGALIYFIYNFNTFTLAEKLTIILIVSGLNLLNILQTQES
jgi:competence protein ComGC